MTPTKKDYFKTFTILGTAVSALMGLNLVGSVLYVLAERWVSSQEAGALRWLSWLFHSEWTDVLVQYVFIIGMPYLAAYLVMMGLPKDVRPVRKLSLEDFMVCLVLALGLGYLLNFAGLFINSFFSMFNHKTIDEMNPVSDMVTAMTPSMFIYACFLGPFMEEVMFRGLLLRRARRFGDWTAVVFCAVLFGLMHGNISQFLYATAIGLVLGYVAVKTNGIRYNVMLHMAVNLYSTILVAGEQFLVDCGFETWVILYGLAVLLVLILMIVGGIYFLVTKGPVMHQQLIRADGFPSPYKKYVYLNPGFILYFLICGIEILFYLL